MYIPLHTYRQKKLPICLSIYCCVKMLDTTEMSKDVKLILAHSFSPWFFGLITV